jgi:hypothetical protein
MPIDLSAEANIPEEQVSAPEVKKDKKKGNTWIGKC